jgi:hypothetical protein
MTQDGSQTENGEVLLTPFDLTEGTSTFDPRQNRGVLRSSHSSRTQVRASFGQIVFLNSVILVKYMNCIYFVNFACIRILSDLFECENSFYNCVEMPFTSVQWNLFFNAEIAVPFLFEFKNPRQKLQMVR